MSYKKCSTVAGLLCERIPFSGVLSVDSDAWDAYTGYKGRLEYYFHTNDSGTAIVVARKLGSNEDSSVIRSKLFLNAAGTWGFECKKSYWRPPLDKNGRECACVSDHEWNIVSLTLALFDVAEKFGKYHVLLNNCTAFRDTLVWSMKKAGPKYAKEAEKLGPVEPGTYSLVKALNKHLKSRNYHVQIEFYPLSAQKENGEKGT